MQTRIKRYTLTIRGKVQHISYRGIIEGTARKLDIKGYVFNDIDNTVKIVCEGLQKSVDVFLDSLKEFARTDIESIEKKEIKGHEIDLTEIGFAKEGNKAYIQCVDPGEPYQRRECGVFCGVCGRG